jgi:hypothetical protein
MTRSHPQDDDTRELVTSFCRHILWLRSLHYIYRELFEGDDSRSLMERTALAFFQNLNKILVDYILLEVGKLTDPATSSVGNRENFTVANLIETVEWSPDCRQEIDKLNETVQSFRKHIKIVRNRLLAHYDKRTVTSGYSLGDFPEGEDEKLLQALERICNVMHEAAFGEIYGDMVPQQDGDVLDLKKALSKAIAFEKLFSDSKGDDLNRLSRLLDDVHRD